MKHAISAAAALALAVMQAAHAQATCSDIVRLLDELDNNFKDIRGEVYDRVFYTPSFSLPGATACEIIVDWDSVYQCGWVINSRDAALAAYETQRATMQACLSGWTPRADPEQVDANHDGLRHMIGTYFVGAGDYLDVEWVVALNERTKDGKTRYHLRVALTYYFE